MRKPVVPSCGAKGTPGLFADGVFDVTTGEWTFRCIRVVEMPAARPRCGWLPREACGSNAPACSSRFHRQVTRPEKGCSGGGDCASVDIAPSRATIRAHSLNRVFSSAGRATALQAVGRRFDPCNTHQNPRLMPRVRNNGAVVQLVRIPACHAGGRGFKSRPLRQYSVARHCLFRIFTASFVWPPNWHPSRFAIEGRSAHRVSLLLSKVTADVGRREVGWPRAGLKEGPATPATRIGMVVPGAVERYVPRRTGQSARVPDALTHVAATLAGARRCSARRAYARRRG